MRQKINLIRHLGILFLTIVIFFLGVFINSHVEDLRVQALYTQLQAQDLDYQNLMTESNYINHLISLKNTNNNVSCDLIKGAYFTSISKLDDSRIKLEEYINSGKVKQDEFYRIKSYYSNIQINYWMMANSISSLCNSNLNTVLFFYADKDKCKECEDQGVHLSYVKSKLKDDILIFSLDSQREGPIQLLKQKYEIDSNNLPSLIINEEKIGFSTNQEIFKKLCDTGLKNEICSNYK